MSAKIILNKTRIFFFFSLNFRSVSRQWCPFAFSKANGKIEKKKKKRSTKAKIKTERIQKVRGK